MKNIPQIAFFLVIIACAGFAGVWIGQNTLMVRQHPHGNASDMHSILHDQLEITTQQEEQLTPIEKKYKRLKALYQGQMKIANMELAQAIKDGGYQSPEIERIVHKIHRAMGSLQGLSLEHLADMQKILSTEQNKKLQEMVVEQLQRNAGE
jgi:Spy/CpxP family protein refolding chaperone